MSLWIYIYIVKSKIYIKEDNMDSKYTETLKRHISTHTEHSAEDRSAVSYLESVLNPEGRINTFFSSDDKWPNYDGMFEYVLNPDISRRPEQNFIVQIKGTHNFTENEGVISYSLKSLAFPAYIAYEVTSDPGIIFLVLNPDIRGKKRIFWKYVSPAFINSINFEQYSATIKFYPEDEIKDTDESMDFFCSRLNQVIDTHLFFLKLDNECLTKEKAFEIIRFRCEEISMEIDSISENHELRDTISRKIVRGLYDLCYSVLVLNAVTLGYTNINQKLAWEVSQFKPETKYLYNFLKGLKYIGIRIPEEGQAERLMLKYYNYLWEIRQFLKINFDYEVLNNLSEFPLDMDKIDKEYYELVSNNITGADLTPINVRISRYYIQKIVPFFVNGERYFEITLQLAGLYATKYNRITVYSKKYISTKYSIQIAYTETEIELWGIKNKIKILNNWRVAIDPVCLNKLAKILMLSTKINRNYGEYISLMNFLTDTEMDLLQIVNLDAERFQRVYDQIYGSTNTRDFGEVILKIRNNYAMQLDNLGRYTIRYVLLNLREEVMEGLLPNQYNGKHLEGIYLTTKCYPFEQNPFISNLPGRKTSKNDLTDIIEIVNDRDKFESVLPYLKIEKLINETGELYFDKKIIANDETINKYNNGLDYWEKNNGFMISEDKGMIYIDSYESTTISILRKLLKLSHSFDRERLKSNEKYLQECGIEFEDNLKKIALKYLFVSSQVMLIYGAAGTGKTTLIKYISQMLGKLKKIFLTKTHTALHNLKMRVCEGEDDVKFSSIDSVIKSNEDIDFDIVIIDECSTIDNRTMKALLDKINDRTKLVLSGDIYQIESIEFGNWFYYAKDIITTKGASVELLHNWRTDKGELSGLWDEVREKNQLLLKSCQWMDLFRKN